MVVPSYLVPYTLLHIISAVITILIIVVINNINFIFVQQQQGNNGGEGVYRQLQPQINRAQDDAMVSYIFQRTHSDTTELSLQHPALAPPPQQPPPPPPPPHIPSQQAPTAVPLSHVQGKFQPLRWPPSNEQVADFVSIVAINSL